jgi:16S rRNA (guanine527-N7)-methyltransferase
VASEYEILLAPHLRGEALGRCIAYCEILERWSRTHNLVRFASKRELVERHVLDALAGLAALDGEVGRLLDVGSGAGLPGVPLLAARPGWRGLLLEPRAKRWAFLRQVVRALGLDAVAVRSRLEELGREEVGFDVATMRAVGGVEGLVELVRTRLAPSGVVLLWTTRAAEERLALGSSWHVLSSPLSGLEQGRLVRLEPCFT